MTKAGNNNIFPQLRKGQYIKPGLTEKSISNTAAHIAANSYENIHVQCFCLLLKIKNLFEGAFVRTPDY